MMEKVKKIIINFSVGIVVLMISYIMLYYMGGETIYREEISSFRNVDALIIQLIGTGLFYIFFSEILKYIEKFVSPEYAKEMTLQKMLKFILVILLGMSVITIILKFANIPQNVKSIYYFNVIMLMIILPIISLISQFREVNTINSILNERRENKEK